MEKKMETMTNHKSARPEVVLDGDSMEQDLFQLMGYVYAHGQHTGTKGVVESGHLKDLGEAFLRKYGPLEGLSPKVHLNTAHMIKRAAIQLESTQKSLKEASGKLRVHEHYMNIMSQLERSNSCRDGGSDLVYDLAATAERMIYAAEEALKRPESFEDIEDDWTAKGNGVSPIQANQ
jgi:hypothetical protein